MPDAPINLLNDLLTTSDTTIRFTWAEGESNGGTPVIDYSLYYDQGLGSDFILLADSLTLNEYQTTDITAGTSYKFKLTARNTVGQSLFSDTLTVLAAKDPDAPLSLQNVPGITTST